MIGPDDLLTIGQLAERCGVSRSALRFYEAEQLLGAQRTAGGQRRYPRGAIRRVAFIRAAQRVGLSLDEVAAALHTLPAGRNPTKADWTRLSRGWRPLLDRQIDQLVRLRDRLDSCIGCGCLSLRSCALYNKGDVAGTHGDGPRYLLGDRPPAPGSGSGSAPGSGRPRSRPQG